MLSSAAPTTSVSSAVAAGHQRQGRDAQAHQPVEQDWSIVFPGRSQSVDGVQSKNDEAAGATSYATADEQRDANQAAAGPLFPFHDGTGRFSRPNSPSYGADDEDEEEREEDRDEDDEDGGEEGGSSAAPISPLEVAFEDDEEEEGTVDMDLEIDATSSLFLSGSEEGGASEMVSRRRSRRASSLASSNWSHLRASRARSPTLPVVFTSGSEGEEEEDQEEEAMYASARERIAVAEEWAFEEALASAHSATSAGLAPRSRPRMSGPNSPLAMRGRAGTSNREEIRVPKRRHRRAGESDKGSKRSNTTAGTRETRRSTSVLGEASARRRGGSGVDSSTNRSQSRRTARRASTAAPASIIDAAAPQRRGTRTQRLVNVILRKVFDVDDADVLDALFRDEGPLAVRHPLEHPAQHTRIRFGLDGGGEEIDERNRSRRRREKQAQGEISEEEEIDADAGKALVALSRRQVLEESSITYAPPDEGGVALTPTHDRDAWKWQSQARVPLPPSRLMAEPSLLEALHSTFFAGLRHVPATTMPLVVGFAAALGGAGAASPARLLGVLAAKFGRGAEGMMGKMLGQDEDEGLQQQQQQQQHGRQDRDERGEEAHSVSARSTSKHSSVGSSSGSGDTLKSSRYSGQQHPVVVERQRRKRSESLVAS